MNGARDAVLAGIRRALHRGEANAAAEAMCRQRLERHARSTVPGGGLLARTAAVERFVERATELAATVEPLATLDAIPAALAAWLDRQGMAPAVRVAPALAGLDWSRAPGLTVRTGPAGATDTASLVPALAGVAETGTLMLISDAGTPTTLNFLPDAHVVVLHADSIVGCYEDTWDLLRSRRRGQPEAWPLLPRSVIFVSGPSRTADIEQIIVLGAHGPRRLHILLLEGGPLPPAENAEDGHCPADPTAVEAGGGDGG